MIEYDGLVIPKGEATDLLEWLGDRKGKPLFEWLKMRSVRAHNYASKPVGKDAIADIIASQRCLAEENAFDQVLSFLDNLKESVSNDNS